jgi:phospholipid transport system substrate-binding protein
MREQHTSWESRPAGAIARRLRAACVVVLLWAGQNAGTGAALESPTAVVQHTADAVVAVLADKSLTTPQKRSKVEQIVYAHFDFTTLSKLVLARNWKQLSPAQQHDFVEEFKRHLSVTYGRNVETYNNERAVITGDRQESNGDWTVKTKIVRPSAEAILVDYRLRKQDDSWQVIDVIIEGVSLVANFRSQFQEILSSSNPDHLIQLLREKNAKGEPLKS